MIRRRQVSLRQLFGLVAACCVASALIPYVVTGYHDFHTCAVCRMNRTCYVYEGYTWRTAYAESACTKWYRESVEPEHEHVWVHARSTAMRNLYGQPYGVIDRDSAGKQIWWLTSDDQLAIYQHLPDPREGEALFISLTDSSPAVQSGNWRAYHSLKNWKESGFQGTWQDHAP
jgi:hypothetical protein